ncbi:MAG: ABC transporter ATP-binding protein, partial [Gammaproteobacteria bacterium]|nr:ABC transporter ATP-binding protein [Gammaproteobacteria bacterium]
RGLRQRLAIGQAILHEPRVVLLDEPASGLDPEARIALGKLFLALRDEGMTLVVSSHILSELEQYATDILILRAGRILEHRSIERPGNRQPFHLQLLNADPRLGQILADHGDVSELEIQENEAHFLFSGDGAAQHRLLTELISRGLSVCSFSPARVSLQDTYLSKVRTLDGDQSI